MAYLTTESIAYFAGYLKLLELLNLDPARYIGAPKYVSPDLAMPGPKVPDPIAELPEKKPVEPEDIDLPLFPLINYNYAVPTPRLQLDETPAAPPVYGDPIFHGPPLYFPPRLTIVSAPEVIVEPFDFRIAASYNLGASQYLITHIQQTNLLSDNDTVVGVLDYLDELLALARSGLDAAAQDAVAAQLEVLSSLLPSHAASLIDHAEAIGFEKVDLEFDNFSARPFADFQNGTATDAALELVDTNNATYINGVLTSEEGQSATEQSDDIADVLNRLEPDSEDSLIASIVDAADDKPSEHSASAKSWQPTGIGEIEIATGSNTATNVAVLHDLHGADASRIIMQDFHETNAIIQLNIYTELDGTLGAALGSGPAFALSLINGVTFPGVGGFGNSSSLTNQASFEHTAGIGEQELYPGGPGILDWNVDYVYGHYFDITLVEQRNFTEDGDVVQTQTVNTKFTAELGDNDQLNIVQHIDYGYGYDLIVVMGDWYETNVIVQLNMLVDDSLWSHSGNSLTNDAAIVSTGGASPLELTETANGLVDALANQDTDFDYELASGLLDNGDGEFNVLFVTGDYTAANIVMQTNVVVDTDVAGNVEAPGQASLTGQSQNNDLANAALIHDVDSISDYQFVGGEIYEESVLLQANIIEQDEIDMEDLSDGQIDPDVIATIAAMSGATDDSSTDAGTQPEIAGGMCSDDVLGGVAS